MGIVGLWGSQHVRPEDRNALARLVPAKFSGTFKFNTHPLSDTDQSMTVFWEKEWRRALVWMFGHLKIVGDLLFQSTCSGAHFAGPPLIVFGRFVLLLASLWRFSHQFNSLGTR